MAIHSPGNEYPAQQVQTGSFGTTILVAQAETGTPSTGGGTSDGNVVVLEGAPGQETIATSNHNTEASTETSSHDTGSYTFPPFDSSTYGAQLFWLTISFGLLYLLMSRIALPRVGEILEVRRDRIEGDLAEAERLRKKTDQAIAAYEAELAEARAKSQGIAEETRTRLKADLDAKRGEVEADLAKKVALAETRIQQTKAKAMSSVDDIAADTAVALVSKLTGKVTLKAARNAVAGVVKG